MFEDLPRREREIFEIVCGAGVATATEVRRAMANPLSRSAVRTLLTRLEERGVLEHDDREGTYVYRPVSRVDNLRENALQQVVRTFFNGSITGAAATLLGLSRSLKSEEIDVLQRAIDAARERER
jgi:BlaI family transcriptional regulator, penicillinase repressor